MFWFHLFTGLKKKQCCTGRVYVLEYCDQHRSKTNKRQGRGRRRRRNRERKKRRVKKRRKKKGRKEGRKGGREGKREREREKIDVNRAQWLWFWFFGESKIIRVEYIY